MTASAAPPRRLDPRRVLGEPAITAGIVLALAIGLVGFETVERNSILVLRPHFATVACACGYAFLGRLAIVLLRERRPIPVLVGATALTLGLAALALAPRLGALAGMPDLGARVAAVPVRDPLVLWATALLTAIFAARAALAVLRGTAAEAEAVALGRLLVRARGAGRYAGPLLFAAALAMPFLPFVDNRLLDIGVLVTTYVMLGWGLNIVVGLAGLLDLGYVAFYAVGAYSYALLATHFGAGFWLCLPVAGIMAAMAGVLLGFPVLRLRGDYLAIVTLGFGEMVRIILLNWASFTHGPDGITGIPRPSLFGLVFKPIAGAGETTFADFFGLAFSSRQRLVFLYYVILAMAMAVNLFTLRVRRLPIGRAWEALREDEIACRSLGINPRNTKLTAFGIGAMFAGFAGTFFATRQGFISPESFTFIESAVILAIVVLGGMGSQLGVVLAALVLIGLPEFFRELHQYRMLAFGGAMVGIMLWRPSGLLAHRAPTIRLNPDAAGGAARGMSGRLVTGEAEP